jgi:hypothetical protein
MPQQLLYNRFSPVSKLFVLRFFPGREAAMKRAFATKKSEPRKKARVELPEYHLTPSRTTSLGEIIWPAPQEQISAARDFIREW